MSTTIAISEETKKRLMELGRKGDTFDHIISVLLTKAKLLDKIEENQKALGVA
ncbi:MAG: hypothetical protein H3Z53_12375 [archaeon]|nr:hypothetical protein [archaeon]MCP8315145.1 hypothetical protein [archaeon]